MTWVILYLLVMAVCVFALCTGWGLIVDDDIYLLPILAGIFWPIGLPICAGFIGAKWFIDNF